MYCRLLLIIRGVIDCNEWRTEKRHECANMGKVKRLEFWWQLYRTSFPVWDLENFRPMDFCWHECTAAVQLVSAEDKTVAPGQYVMRKTWTRSWEIKHYAEIKMEANSATCSGHGRLKRSSCHASVTPSEYTTTTHNSIIYREWKFSLSNSYCAWLQIAV